jgi:hypothetical protein
VQLGLLDDSDIKNVKYTSYDKRLSNYGFDYKYCTDTDDEQKYVHEKNRGFMTLKRSKKKKHIEKLWKTMFMKLHGAAAMINQFISVHTKVQYFGR